jgi:DNA-binding CsgD family transcriptional regulator
MTAASELEQGRQSFARNAWREAFMRLSAVDSESPLEPEDIERLGISAYLIGNESDSLEMLARAHREWLKHDEVERAARSAFWLGFVLLQKGQRAQGNGWIARSRRLLDEGQRDCVERGYLLLPIALQHVAERDLTTAHDTFTKAATIGERFGDRDLMTLGRQGRGRTLINLGRIAEGVALMDEVMVAVTTGDVSPIIVGTIYCSVIEACYEMFDLQRAQEWTVALTAWCASQPDLVPYRGQCLVRRAEIMQLHGEWPDAMDEAMRACECLSEQPAAAAAFAQQAELYRLQGDFAKADDAYRQASMTSRRPQPGIALLRLAQGQVEGAVAAITRVMDEAQDRRTRARALIVYVEVMLAAHDVSAARAAVDELLQIAATFDAPFLSASAAQAQGAVLLAESDPRAALGPLRRAWTAWEELGAPYEAACVRVLTGLACRALGDSSSADMELDAARQVFQSLGAAPDLARVRELLSRAEGPKVVGGLTHREIEVLRLVATGRTNRAIADELDISEKTVARHLSNIFTKLDISSRAAATAYAYQHNLISADT